LNADTHRRRKGFDVQLQRQIPQVPATRDPQKGAAGWAFLVWLFGGGLGLAILVFLILKIF
jgi:hypothetical protein